MIGFSALLVGVPGLCGYGVRALRGRAETYLKCRTEW